MGLEVMHTEIVFILSYCQNAVTRPMQVSYMYVSFEYSLVMVQTSCRK